MLLQSICFIEHLEFRYAADELGKLGRIEYESMEKGYGQVVE